jgi:hypothetical protein
MTPTADFLLPFPLLSAVLTLFSDKLFPSKDKMVVAAQVQIL